MQRGFVSSFNYEPPASIKTPSIVISWDSSDVLRVGGHNIDARAITMEASPKVTGIAIEETESGPKVLYNPAKASLVEAHATEIARAIEHGHVTSGAQLEKIIVSAVPNRTRFEALGLPKAAAGAPDRWSARLGNHLYTEANKPEFVSNLSGMAEKSACCEFVAYDDNGIAFATERSPHPPPLIVTYELRDTPSLAEHVEAAAKQGRPLIFLGASEDRVEALALQATVGNGKGRDLNEMAEWLGRQESGAKGPRVDGIAADDLTGNRGFLKGLADRFSAGAWELLTRLTMKEPAPSWTQAEVSRLEEGPARDLVRSIGWDPGKDGVPAAVMMKFSGGNAGLPPVDVSVVAGFSDANLPIGRQNLYAIHEKNFALASARQESLFRYMLSMKKELTNLPGGRAERIAFLVRHGNNRQLLSLREFIDEMVRHGDKQAG